MMTNNKNLLLKFNSTGLRFPTMIPDRMIRMRMHWV